MNSYKLYGTSLAFRSHSGLTVYKFYLLSTLVADCRFTFISYLSHSHLPSDFPNIALSSRSKYVASLHLPAAFAMLPSFILSKCSYHRRRFVNFNLFLHFICHLYFYSIPEMFQITSFTFIFLFGSYAGFCTTRLGTVYMINFTVIKTPMLVMLETSLIL